MNKQPRILDSAPRELMLVDDVTGDGDPYNTADSRRTRVRGVVEFVSAGRTYIGDREPATSERPRFLRDDFVTQPRATRR